MAAKLEDLGDVTVDDNTAGRRIRGVRIAAIAPGGEMAMSAAFDYEEIYRHISASQWELVGYAYEYRDVARGGRRAYHLHDDLYHAHCVDPSAHRRDHHYRAPEMDVYEAHDEFRRLYVTGLTVRCDDLRLALVRR